MTALDGHRLLLTGAGGFIGSALAPALLAQGACVRALIGPPGAETAIALPDCESHFAEIDDLDMLRRLVEGCDAVIHLAGPPSVAASFAAPAEFARIHTVGTATLLQACAQADIRRIVYLSSAEIYGQPETNPVGEDQLPRPCSPYGAAKLGAEAFLRCCAEAYRFEAVILRPFSIYGPGLPERSIVGRLLSQALWATEITVGDLRPVRDYCFLDDLVEAVLRSVTAAIPERVRSYNIGSGTGVSVAALAEHALRVAGRSLRVAATGSHDRPLGADIRELIADPRRAAEELGWSAATPLPVGLERTAAWLREIGPWR